MTDDKRRLSLTGEQFEDVIEDARAQGRAEATGGVVAMAIWVTIGFVIGVGVGFVIWELL